MIKDTDPSDKAKTRDINTILKIIHDVSQGGYELRNVLNYYGIPGIGKTFLGFSIGNHCRKMNIPFARIDFDPEENPPAQAYEINPHKIIHLLLQDLAAWESFSELQSPQKMKPTDDDLSRFIHLTQSHTKTAPLMLIFDSTDKAPQSVIRWMENNIVAPLCQNLKCLILWTGRYPQKLVSDVVIRSTDCRPVSPLTPAATKKQICTMDPGLAGAASRIQNLTYGYPSGNQKLVEILMKNQNIGDKELIKILAEEVLIPDVFKDMPSDLIDACQALSIVRWFDAMLMEDILSEFVDGFTEDTPYFTVIGTLRKKILVFPNEGKPGYYLEKIIAHILRQYMIAYEKERFVTITEVASKFYEQGIFTVSGETRNGFFLEWLWHQANLYALKKIGNETLRLNLENHLMIIFDTFYGNDKADVRMAGQSRLKNDIAKDRAAFEKVMGKDGYENLLCLIGDFSLENRKSNEMTEG